MADQPYPVTDLGTPMTTPSTWRETERLAPWPGRSRRASAVRLRVRIPLRFTDDYSTTATDFRSIAIEAQLHILLPLCETLRNRKVINTKAAR